VESGWECPDDGCEGFEIIGISEKMDVMIVVRRRRCTKLQSWREEDSGKSGEDEARVVRWILQSHDRGQDVLRIPFLAISRV
jgi:hypothetical protein